MRLNRKQIVRTTLFAALGLVVVFALYLVLLCHPGLFFRYAFTRGGITLYSDEPIPPEAARRMLEVVKRRLARSPLAASGRVKDLRIYICNRRWRFVLFANFRYKAGGLAYSRSPTISSSGRPISRRIAWSATRAGKCRASAR